MNYSYYDSPIEKVLNMLGYKDGPQDVYVAFDSISPFYGQRIDPSRDVEGFSEGEDGDDEEGFLVRFSLMNEEMLWMNQAALESLDRPGVRSDYRPYYYVFEMFVPSSDVGMIEKCDSLLRFFDLSYFRLMDAGLEANLGQGMRWRRGKLSAELASRSSFNDHDDFVSFIGLLGYSGEGGSDYARLEIWLKGLHDDAAEKVEMKARKALRELVLDSGEDPLWDSRLSRYLCDSDDELIARAYYVGQANATCIGPAVPHQWGQSIGNPGIYFDLGRPIDSIRRRMVAGDKVEVDRNVIRVGRLGLETLVISHWDGDHYDGAVHLLSLRNTSFDPEFWILPDISFPSKALSLIIYLLVARKLVVCVGSNSSLSGSRVFSYYKGTGTTVNDSGILLKVRDTVFSGDCNYKYWPDALLIECSDLKNLVVPHHGSANYDISKLRSALNGSPSPSSAYISVGNRLSNGNKPYKSRYHSGHPSSTHIADLRNLGFMVECTKDLPTIKWPYYKIGNL